jgi:hypothetical protein
MTAVNGQLLIVRSELGDVIGENDGLVVYDHAVIGRPNCPR